MGSTRREAAQAFADELREAIGDRLEAVLLFGSVARAEDTAGSDVDLLVVLEDDQPIPDLSTRIGRWMIEHGDVLQVHVLSRAEYEEMQGRGTAFAHTLRREGQALA